MRQGRHVVANGVRLHYVRFGQGRAPLVLLPGITSPAATWEFVAQALASRNDVYVIDIRGRGLSQGGAELGYRLDDYAADAAGLIQALGLAAPAVLGHSMGARIAVRLAARYPDMVGKLVLADPPVSGPGRRPYPIPLSFYLESLDTVARGLGYEEMKKGLPWSEEKLDLRMEWLPTCDRHAIIESYRSFHEEDIHGNLGDIAAPTLLLYAQRGGTVSDEEAVELSSAIGRCDMKRIDDAGHMIPWDQLDAFVEAVQGFVGG
ncbi:MAG TPA: alpha/beta hydrolase [Ramlibacter sp.]|nr:alpha/beta hydrolase [Ramlibacter sp.]